MTPQEKLLRDAREQTRLTVSILANGIGETFKACSHYDENVDLILMQANRLLPPAILEAQKADAAYMDTFDHRRLFRTRVRLRARTREESQAAQDSPEERQRQKESGLT